MRSKLRAVSSRSQQQGIALLSVVLITAVMVVSLTLFTEHVQKDARRQQNARLYNQAWWYGDSAEKVIASTLKELITIKTVHLGQPWATETYYPIDGGTIGGVMVDQRACLNINGLLSDKRPGEVDKIAVEQFQQLLTNLHELEGTEEQALVMNESTRKQLVSRVVDWLDADFDTVNADGAEDQDYIAGGSTYEQSYYTANAPFASLDEILQTGAINRQQLDALSPYICALPVPGRKVNLNTLTPNQAPLLAALFFNQINVEEAEKILSERPRNGFIGINDIYELPQMQEVNFSEQQSAFLGKQLVMKSDAFLARIKVNFQGLNMQINSFYFIKKKKIHRVQRIIGET